MPGCWRRSAFGIDAMALVRRERDPADPTQARLLEIYAQRRLGGEPVSRIVGEKEFWSLRFTVNEATLVPRPETEMLVSEAIGFLEARKSQKFVDLGTGSGAIAVSIAAGLPRAQGWATDISQAALEAARINAERHRRQRARLTFRQGSWWQAVPHTELFDLIVANPPYIATERIDDLARRCAFSIRGWLLMAAGTGSTPIAPSRRRRLGGSGRAASRCSKSATIRAMWCKKCSSGPVSGLPRC